MYKQLIHTPIVIIAILFRLFLAYVLTDYELQELQFDLTPPITSLEEIWPEPNDAYFERFRKEYRLDELVKDAKSDYEKVIIVTNWVSNLWEHNGWNHPDVSDPLAILELVKQGNRYACVEFSVVLTGALRAIGIPARKLSLKRANVETNSLGPGHVVTEAYLADLGKWIMADGQLNAIPTLNGKPLNAVELQAALREIKEGLSVASLDEAYQGKDSPSHAEYFGWIAPYLFYFDFPLDHRYVDNKNKQKIMLVPIGAKKPKIFQRTQPITDMSYTHSLKLFYQKPENFDPRKSKKKG